MYSVEYPKTENVFNRDPDTHKLIVGDLRVPAFGQIKTWHVTEKIDGQNVRVVYSPDEQRVEFRGRSDRASLPRDLVAYLEGIFTQEKMSDQFDEFICMEHNNPRSSVTIYGEGYGPGIQKDGARYAPTKMFRMFDVMYHWRETENYWKNSWAMMETVDMIAANFGESLLAPVLGEEESLEQIVDFVSGGVESLVAYYDGNTAGVDAEGIIARSDPYLYTHRGSRVMFKLKGEDLS